MICLSLGQHALQGHQARGHWMGAQLDLRHDKESNLLRSAPYRYVCTMDLHVGGCPKITSVDAGGREPPEYMFMGCSVFPHGYRSLVAVWKRPGSLRCRSWATLSRSSISSQTDQSPEESLGIECNPPHPPPSRQSFCSAAVSRFFCSDDVSY